MSVLSERRLSSKELAEWLGVTENSLRRDRVHGAGPAYYKIGNRVVYLERDVAAWLETRRHNSTAQYSRRYARRASGAA